MKISEELSEDYSIIQSMFGDKQVTFRLTNTIKQLLAENLNKDHQINCPTCNRYGHHECDEFRKIDWLAEADRLLRGEK